MASTKEILRAVEKLEQDRRSADLCNPDTRIEEYRKQKREIEKELTKLLDNPPQSKNEYDMFTYRTYRSIKTWYKEFKPIFEQYEFLMLVSNLDSLD